LILGLMFGMMGYFTFDVLLTRLRSRYRRRLGRTGRVSVLVQRDGM